MKTPNLHFFASSVATWATTNDKRDLRELLRMMDKEGFAYNLFSVPGPHTQDYEIRMYHPQVYGAVWLGFFEPKKRS